MFVKPNPGIKIRDPHTKTFLPVDGTNVEETPFWLRRLRDGDVTIVKTNQTEKREVSRKGKGESA